MRATSRYFVLVLFLLPLMGVAQPHVEWASYIIDYSSQKGEKEYSAEQALGKPNKCPASGDSPCAWVPVTDEGVTEEWIHVGFEKPMRIQQVAIAQNFYPGAVEKVILYDEKGHQRT